jgi:hypothetical protein
MLPATIVRAAIELIGAELVIRLIGLWAVLLGLFAWVTSCWAGDVVFETDFAEGDIASQGWVVEGDWIVTTYPAPEGKNPGPVVRFAANKPDGALRRSFPVVADPDQLVLNVDYGWGWGDASQPADGLSFMLLDEKGSGYLFDFHRCTAAWAVQWGKVVDGKPVGNNVWAPAEIDATRPSVRDGGGLHRVTITRQQGGDWAVVCPDWNGGRGGSISFSDATTTSFSQVVLMGTKNFDEQVFDRIKLSVPARQPAVARSVSEFLGSIGVVTTFPDRGQPLDKTVEMVKYCGFRWVRGGIEGVTENGATTMQTYLDLHKATGVKFNWGLVSGGVDIERLIRTGRQLAEADALLAFEGNNEPNNWGVTYQGEKGGGGAPSWMAVAKLQRDLYKAVKADPLLKTYPVWSLSENGAQTDNVGLQFLTIPPGARTLMPEGTQYADFANVHNYTYHPGSPNVGDNKTWNAADPGPACKVDGLYGNYGRTWAKQFAGYSEEELKTLPRVTTETGTTIGGEVTEEIQGLNLLTTYLDQFARGWSYTAVYLLRDRVDEAGNQSFGFFNRDYSPRKAATYLHNLTTILSDSGTPTELSSLDYTIQPQPATVHDLLLQKSDGTLYLVVWNERLQGSNEVTVQMEFGEERSGVTVYDPTIGADVVSGPTSGKSLRLTLSDHPVVITIPAAQ